MSLYALTLWQPWAWAILHAGKRVENRAWAPPAYLRGKLFALHAGLRYDSEGAEYLRDIFHVQPPGRKEIDAGAIVGIARLVGHEIRQGIFQAAGDEWFSGPIGWRLADVVSIQPPVPTKGAQGLWRVAEPALSLVRERYRAALDTIQPCSAPAPAPAQDVSAPAVSQDGPGEDAARVRAT